LAWICCPSDGLQICGILAPSGRSFSAWRHPSRAPGHLARNVLSICNKCVSLSCNSEKLGSDSRAQRKETHWKDRICSKGRRVRCLSGWEVVSVVLGSDEQIFVKMAKKPIDAGHIMQGFLFASFQDIELREHDRAKNGDGVRMVLRCEDGAGNEARIESVLTGERGPYNYQPQLNPKFEPKR
jgi:hypothetical protein